MRVTKRGRTTIPKHLCDPIGMYNNSEVEITPVEHRVPIRKPLAGEHSVDRIYGILNGDNTNEYIDELRGRQTPVPPQPRRHLFYARRLFLRELFLRLKGEVSKQYGSVEPMPGMR